MQVSVAAETLFVPPPPPPPSHLADFEIPYPYPLYRMDEKEVKTKLKPNQVSSCDSLSFLTAT